MRPLLLSIVAWCFALGGVAQARQPDLLLVLADDLGDDALLDAVTPEIDTFASESVRFPNFYTQANCSPTRIMLMTGKQPLPAFRIGTIIHPVSLNADPVTNPALPVAELVLPEALKTTGYATAFFGKWHMSNEHDTPSLKDSMRVHGFDHTAAATSFGAPYAGGTGFLAWFPEIKNGRTSKCFTYNTTEIVDEFLAWWAATPSPKFAYVAFHAPHERFHTPPANLLPPGMVVGESDREKYLAMVTALDTEFGRLLDGIDRPNTVVAFASDNGTPSNVAPPGLEDKVKTSMYDGGVSPPLFVRGTHFPQRTVQDLVSGTDLWATFAELANYRGQIPRDSRSFVQGLLNSSEWVSREDVVAGLRKPNGPGPYTIYRRMIFDGTHKLIVGGTTETPTETLLGAGDTPVPQDPSIVAALRARLAAQGF